MDLQGGGVFKGDGDEDAHEHTWDCVDLVWYQAEPPWETGVAGILEDELGEFKVHGRHDFIIPGDVQVKKSLVLDLSSVPCAA